MNLKTSLTVRLNEEQFKFLMATSEALEVTPSKFLRMLVNSMMVTSTKAMEGALKGVANEDIEADKHD